MPLKGVRGCELQLAGNRVALANPLKALRPQDLSLVSACIKDLIREQMGRQGEERKRAGMFSL